MDKVRELITREPKQDLSITKSLLLRLKVRFGQLSVTLSNAGHARKCEGNYCTFSLAMPMYCGLRGFFRPLKDALRNKVAPF